MTDDVVQIKYILPCDGQERTIELETLEITVDDLTNMIVESCADMLVAGKKYKLRLGGIELALGTSLEYIEDLFNTTFSLDEVLEPG